MIYGESSETDEEMLSKCSKVVLKELTRTIPVRDVLINPYNVLEASKEAKGFIDQNRTTQ